MRCKLLDVVVGIAPRATTGALRIEEALPLVDAERLGVHSCELGSHRDHVQRPL